MDELYERDLLAWAEQQVALLRAGKLALIDAGHIAEELAELALKERHELAHRYTILLSHLLKWRHQPERRGASWRNTIRDQRVRIERLLRRTPSLRHVMADEEWRADVWVDAVGKAVHEAGLEYSALPAACPWTAAQVEGQGYFPD